MTNGYNIAKRPTWWLFLSLFAFSLSHLLTISCTQDAYDKGEGPYSLMHADFIDAHANQARQIDYITTDDGETFRVAELTADWITTSDSVYRCILYYNKVKGVDGSYMAEPISIALVPCPLILPLEKVGKEMKTDPVRFESAWVSRSGKYLNFSIYLMTGTPDDENATQQLAVVRDSVSTNADGTRTMCLSLYHDQGNIPEYYSTQTYVSLLTKEIDADSARISINTYQGLVEKTLPLNASGTIR